MGHRRLFAQPGGEGLQMGQKFGLVDATSRLGGHREFDRIETAQIVEREVGVTAEIHPIVEVLGPFVVEIDGRDHRRQRDGGGTDAQQKTPVAGDDEVGEPLHHAATATGGGGTLGDFYLHGQQAHHCRQEGDRKEPGGGDSGRRDIPQVPEWR